MKGFYRTEQTGRGFRWGNFDVSRLSETAGRGQLLGIEAGGRKFGMYVSDRGHSVRLFEDGREIPLEVGDTGRLRVRVAELERVFDAAQDLAWAVQEHRADQAALNAYLDVAEVAARPVVPEGEQG